MFTDKGSGNVERTTHRMGVGESPSHGHDLSLVPPEATIILARIQNSEYFHVMINGEPIPVVCHKDADFFSEIGKYLHAERVRAEIDPVTGGGII